MSRVPERRRAGRDVTRSVRAPHLHSTLRGFCLGSFAFFGREIEEGAEIQFVFEEHGSHDRPTLYEYRPLVRAFVEARGGRLLGHGDTVIALEALGREPAAGIYARAHAGARAEHALFRTVLLPLLADVAESCGGFDWDDETFDRAYASLEQSLFGEERAYAAIAPLVGVEAGGIVELGDGMRVRHAADGELTAHWPDAARLAPESFGRETDRMCVLELERTLPAAGGEPPDAPGEIADAVTALQACNVWADLRGPGALRAARLASLRRQTRASDRRDPASGRADQARSLSRRDRAHTARQADVSGARSRAGRRARPMGALALSDCALPGRAAARGAGGAPRCRRRRVGGFASSCDPARGVRAASGGQPSTCCDG